jgi:CBS domain-containing protein
MKHQRIGSLMTDEVVAVTPGTPFKDVATLLAEHGISGVPVVDRDDKVLGVVSETDLMLHRTRGTAGDVPSRRPRFTRASRTSAAKTRARTAGELMSSPAVTVRAAESIARAARTMAQHRVERMPVVDEENRLVGIVTRRDLLRVFLRPDAEIRAEIIDDVLVRGLWLAPHAIGVRVEDGVVTLEGRLERSSEVPLAAQMAGQVDGVVAVVNRLTFRFDDSRLAGLRHA